MRANRSPAPEHSASVPCIKRQNGKDLAVDTLSAGGAQYRACHTQHNSRLISGILTDSNTLDNAEGPEVFYVEPVIPGLRAEKENLTPKRVRVIGGIFMEQTSSRDRRDGMGSHYGRGLIQKCRSVE